MNADGGSLEIVAYNRVNGYAYAVSGVKGRLIAVDLNGSLDGDKVISLSGTEYDVKSLVDGFAYGDMTSVAVSPDGKAALPLRFRRKIMREMVPSRCSPAKMTAR